MRVKAIRPFPFFLLVVLLLGISTGCNRTAVPDTGVPGVVRQTGGVVLMENHQVALSVWHAADIRDAVVVHVDTHDDCRHVEASRVRKLQRLLKRKDYAAIQRVSDPDSAAQWITPSSDFLFDLGSFLYPAIQSGMIRHLIWVVPDTTLSPERIEVLVRHLQGVLKVNQLDALTTGTNQFVFRLNRAAFTVTTLDALDPQLPGACLDIDTDFFSFAEAQAQGHLTGPLRADPETVCQTLRRKVPEPAPVTVCSSVPGGYLPVSLRFLADGIMDFFVDGAWPEDARALLAADHLIRSRNTPPGTPPSPVRATYLPAYRHLQGITSLMQGRDIAAVAAMETAAALQPVYRKSLLDLVDIFISLQKPASAWKAWNAAREVAGTDTTDLLAVKTRLYLNTGNLPEARQTIDRLLNWDRTPYHLALHAAVTMRENRLDEAEAIYREILEASPYQPNFLHSLALVMEAKGQIPEAMDLYRRVIAIHPTHADARENLAYQLLQRGKLSEAEHQLRTALESDPFDITSLNNLGRILHRRRQFPESVNTFLQAIRINPDIPEVHANLAAVQLEAGDPAGAFRAAEAALRLRPDWPALVQFRELARQAVIPPTNPATATPQPDAPAVENKR
ncbi:MAG: hypothetical protein A2498_07690 [Lentisphaerae bacterium RIFOXYC12_FULL_60_16]|nr:MAG: hypothetical protein A2498_07690 [Lentisphaerae bacterium RIFOXYC12_FULL_60_16]